MHSCRCSSQHMSHRKLRRACAQSEALNQTPGSCMCQGHSPHCKPDKIQCKCYCSNSRLRRTIRLRIRLSIHTLCPAVSPSRTQFRCSRRHRRQRWPRDNSPDHRTSGRGLLCWSSYYTRRPVRRHGSRPSSGPPCRPLCQSSSRVFQSCMRLLEGRNCSARRPGRPESCW